MVITRRQLFHMLPLPPATEKQWSHRCTFVMRPGACALTTMPSQRLHWYKAMKLVHAC
jgi:hypothetical protein